MTMNRIGGSYRDPSGFLFIDDGTLYRQIAASYQPDYEHLVDSGLLAELVEDGLLIPHDEVDHPGLAGFESPYKVLRPERVPFISYPFEWCFSQLKDAALLTLDLQKRALTRGMWLKDASAYNIQFRGCSPVFIDTLSFELYPKGSPWIAYQQFCEHFLAPLALMTRRHVGLGALLRASLEGVPLEIVSRLLPMRSRLEPSMLMHIHLHARAQRKHAVTSDESVRKLRKASMSLQALRGILDSLESTIRRMHWPPNGTEWSEYYDHTNYDDASAAAKQSCISRWIDDVAPSEVWDLGANTGRFARLASERSIPTVASDIDAGAVEKMYLAGRQHGDRSLHPLLMDLANPTPGLGWDNRERASFTERGPADLVLALALIHHLAIGRNIPLDSIATVLARLGRRVVVEFVPKGDSQVDHMLTTRADIPSDYTEAGFEAAFAPLFETEERHTLEGSARVLYRFRRRIP
jgi:SAM-dependent methyltransferase